MLSTVDLERLIAVKRLEIEKEKIMLGLAPAEASDNIQNGEQGVEAAKPHVSFARGGTLGENNATAAQEKKKDSASELEGEIPPDLDRYIREHETQNSPFYLGLEFAYSPLVTSYDIYYGKSDDDSGGMTLSWAKFRS
ncbi:uncharacterized protein LOC114359243 [Ostrinia furnacalis]|uniref:uncharacterized protein LOC114359243 n=1 Tax=Ostrinia furnacalis TaxID=93504 RepID=UPI00103C9BF0|nr:uncharacterized protein LOC114359243 [Ostrinia furnacalis]